MTFSSHPVDGTGSCPFWNFLFPQLQVFVPIGRISPDVRTLAAYTDPQRSQTATTRSGSPILFTQIILIISYSFSYWPRYVGWPLYTDSERDDDLAHEDDP